MIIVPGGYGFYPWGYGGLGLGGYYGGYYDPFDPYGYGGYGGYGGSYGGGYPAYSSQDDDDGAVRIKVKPREASVYVDGYYVGHVDDFDGVLSAPAPRTGTASARNPRPGVRAADGRRAHRPGSDDHVSRRDAAELRP